MPRTRFERTWPSGTQEPSHDSHQPKCEFRNTPRLLLNTFHKLGESLFAPGTEVLISQIEEQIKHLTRPTIYIHIPFCRTQCTFCNFTTTQYQAEAARKYIRALDEQLAQLVSKYPNLDLSKVYIGGGTPATVINELLDLIDKYHLGSSDAIQQSNQTIDTPMMDTHNPNQNLDTTTATTSNHQISIEAHPQDFAHLSPETLRRMKKSIGRVSIGVQSFDNNLLKDMNRSNGDTPLLYIQRAIDSGLQVNVDLIFGLKGQSIQSFVNDLEQLIAIGTPQITCYPLMGGNEALEKQSPQADAFYRAMLDTFKTYGYRPLTPWCFTTLNETAQGEYISDTDSESREQIIGLGVGAISKIGPYFAINSFNIPEYFRLIHDNKTPLMAARKLSRFQEAQYFLLTGLFGMSVHTRRLTGNLITDTFIRAQLLTLSALGIVQKVTSTREDAMGTEYRLTETGMFCLSEIMSSFYAGLGEFRKEHNPGIIGKIR